MASLLNKGSTSSLILWVGPSLGVASGLYSLPFAFPVRVRMLLRSPWWLNNNHQITFVGHFKNQI